LRGKPVEPLPQPFLLGHAFVGNAAGHRESPLPQDPSLG
jgi:hypothetical protein